MEKFVVEIVLTLIIITGMGSIFVANFGSALPISCDRDNLCENAITAAKYGYDDRWEGSTLFPCLITDCCYNDEEGVGKSWEMCIDENHGSFATQQELEEFCRSEFQTMNTKYLFHCVDSSHVCNEPGCYENCNYNGDCEEGEYILCSDCW
jgi:hypothetical protein